MSDPIATVVVVPRERFSLASTALDRLLSRTEPRVPVVYVDGRSPRGLARRLAREELSGRLQLLRTDHYLAGNEARNLATSRVETKYVVYLDNDVLVQDGWLDSLIECAESTGASVVGPLYMIGPLSRPVVHTAGAMGGVVHRGGKRHLVETQLHCGLNQDVAVQTLRRLQCDQVEFHCILARMEVLEDLGGLDSLLLSFFDHVDLCQQVRDAGGTVYIEPSSVVTYVPPPPPVRPSDLPMFLLRWSRAWYRSSLEHFCDKWDLDPSDPGFDSHEEYRRLQRQRAFTRFRIVDESLGRFLESTLVTRMQRRRSSIAT